MRDICELVWCVLIGVLRSRVALEAEVLVLRHQLNVLRGKCPKRVAFSNSDCLVVAGSYRLAPGVLNALKILQPTTLIGWYRAGFPAYWRWKSRPLGGRPSTPPEIRQLVRDMSIANFLWAHRAFTASSSSSASMSVKPQSPNTWRSVSSLLPKAGGHSCVIMLTASRRWIYAWFPPSPSRLLYGLLILQHDRRQILWLAVTAHPTAEWIARQLTEAYGWTAAPAIHCP